MINRYAILVTIALSFIATAKPGRQPTKEAPLPPGCADDRNDSGVCEIPTAPAAPTSLATEAPPKESKKKKSVPAAKR